VEDYFANWNRDDVTNDANESKQKRARIALVTLNSVEKFLCRRLILRQLDRDPRMDRELTKYGPVGMVYLCSARAAQVYMYALAIPTLAFTFAGVEAVSTPLWILFLLFAGFSIFRSISSAKAGKTWRKHGTE
jgi:hypothetical protein